MKTINLEFLIACHHNGCLHNIPYVWAAKPSPSLTTDQITGSDCSGWMRYLFGRQGIGLPEGSQEQMEWFKSQGLTAETDYTAISTWSGNLWICFALDTRAEGGHPGHVWLVHEGETMECYGGVGVGERPANTRILRSLFHAGFEVPAK